MTIQKSIAGAALTVALLVASSGVALAQTTTTTPTTPNTGAGGDAAANMLVLGTSALLALSSGVYLARRVAAR